MLHWLSRRLLTSFLTLFGITTITFLLARVVPSDPAVVYIGPLARPAEIARVTKQLGLDRPLPVAVRRLPARAREGDWGTSLATKEPVLGGHRAPAPGDARARLLAMVIALADRDPARRSRRASPGRAHRRVRPGRLGDRHLRCPCSGSACCCRRSVSGKLGLLPATSRLSLDTSVLQPIPHLTRASASSTPWSPATGPASAMRRRISSCPRSRSRRIRPASSRA